MQAANLGSSFGYCAEDEHRRQASHCAIGHKLCTNPPLIPEGVTSSHLMRPPVIAGGAAVAVLQRRLQVAAGLLPQPAGSMSQS